MPALSGIMQKSVFTAHIINCLVAHVQQRIINLSLPVRRTSDVLCYTNKVGYSLLCVSCHLLKWREKLLQRPPFHREVYVVWQWTCIEVPVFVGWQHSEQHALAHTTDYFTTSFRAPQQVHKYMDASMTQRQIYTMPSTMDRIAWQISQVMLISSALMSFFL